MSSLLMLKKGFSIGGVPHRILIKNMGIAFN